ncbi:MAG TPA: hypothetical protein VFV55_00010 [Usitatibacteraceae bacterium]|nr:hypothetical protein [Usitatibacteraceae bacterium]
MKDFRDHFIEKALDKAVGAYRPDKSPRSRIARIAIIAALAFATFVGFWTILHLSTPRPGPPVERKPITVELLPAPAKR